MKAKFILMLILLISKVYSQEQYFSKSDTKLYASNTYNSPIKGYFKYGAAILLLSPTKNGWYKVQSDNLSDGFVPAKFVSKSLNVADIYTKDIDNPIIEGGDNFYGGNHLFVLGAGLRSRALPNKTARLKEILTCGEPVSVNYVSINPDEWVNISGSFSTKYAKYVQRKYLGNRPNFEELINQFDRLEQNNIQERKTISERLVELAWNSEKSKLTIAYNRYYLLAKQLNDEKLIKDTEFNILLSQKLSVEKKYENIILFSEKIELVLRGKKTNKFTISLKDILKLYGKPPKTEKITDECGVYLSDLLYHYTDLDIAVDEKQNLAELVSVRINSNNKLFIENSILDDTTSERDFVIKYGEYLDTFFKSPHIYYFGLDGDSIWVEFKDGKLFQVGINFDC